MLHMPGSVFPQTLGSHLRILSVSTAQHRTCLYLVLLQLKESCSSWSMDLVIEPQYANAGSNAAALSVNDV